jgi:hypothetical protein
MKFTNEDSKTDYARSERLDREIRQSPLANLVSSHLRSNGMRQIDFCRHTGFDQGLLSKILSSVVTTLNIETALKLAEGMNIPPRVIFEAIGKKEVDEMLRRFYSNKSVATDA